MVVDDDNFAESSADEDDSGEEHGLPSNPPWGTGVSYSQRLQTTRFLPKKMLMIMLLLLKAAGPPSRVEAVELFAGCHSVTNGIRSMGFPAIGLDMSTVSEWDDLNTSAGFLRALTYVMALEPGGFLWAAPPCSSWVWVDRYQTGRSREQSLGDETRRSVHRANMQVSRVVLLVARAMLLHNAVCIAEQPSSSLFSLHPCWLELVNAMDGALEQIHMWMQPYGGSTPKATLLYGNHPALESLWKPRDTSAPSLVQTCVRYLDSAGIPRAYGTKFLKGTQSYPIGFGKAVADLFCNIRYVCPGVPLDQLSSIPCNLDDSWADADLDKVLADLKALPS